MGLLQIQFRKRKRCEDTCPDLAAVAESGPALGDWPSGPNVSDTEGGSDEEMWLYSGKAEILPREAD